MQPLTTPLLLAAHYLLLILVVLPRLRPALVLWERHRRYPTIDVVEDVLHGRVGCPIAEGVEGGGVYDAGCEVGTGEVDFRDEADEGGVRWGSD